MDNKLTRMLQFRGGFTLIEVLVALCILSFAVLGLVALQLTALRDNRDAQMRTVAAVQVQNMADRVRANRPSKNLRCEIEAWQKETRCMLPCTTAEVQCNNNQYTIKVAWQGLNRDAGSNKQCMISKIIV